MDKRTKTKLITTVICLIISFVALYMFLFVVDVSQKWRVVLIVIAVFWIISGISNLYDFLKKKP